MADGVVTMQIVRTYTFPCGHRTVVHGNEPNPVTFNDRCRVVCPDCGDSFEPKGSMIHERLEP